MPANLQNSSSKQKAGASQPSQAATNLERAKPITFVTRIRLPDAATTKGRRRKTPPPTPPRELSDEELREQSAWKEVQETGKPVLLDDKLLIPEGMSAWDAIEFLPGGLREQTRAAMQDNVSKAYYGAVEHMRETLLEKVGDESEKSKYRTFSYAAQMAIAETLVPKQFGMPEVSMEELLRQYDTRR